LSEVNEEEFTLTFIMQTMMNWNDSRIKINLDVINSNLARDDR